MLMLFPLLLHYFIDFPLIPWVLARTACVFYSLLLKQGQSQCAGGNSLSVSQEAFAAWTQHFPSLVSCSCLLSADTVFTVLHSLIPWPTKTIRHVKQEYAARSWAKYKKWLCVCLSDASNSQTQKRNPSVVVFSRSLSFSLSLPYHLKVWTKTCRLLESLIWMSGMHKHTESCGILLLCPVTLSKINQAFSLWGRATGHKSYKSAESRSDAIIFSLQSSV